MQLARKRIIEDTPTARIRSAPQGYVEIIGHGSLLDGPPILSPLTGRICTWYRYRIEEHQRSGKKSAWVTVESGESDALFLLNDGTGVCLIDPEGAHVTPAVRERWYGPNRDSRPQTTGNRWLGRFRFIEERMHPGDPLYALGLFKTTGGTADQAQINEDLRELVREWKRDSAALLTRFDGNRDGQIDVAEFEQVREAALKEVLARHAEYAAAPPLNIMSQTHDRQHPYLLSAFPEFDLLRRYHRLATMWFAAFLATGAIPAWLVGLRLAAGGQ
jgi:hypothetical protein